MYEIILLAVGFLFGVFAVLSKHRIKLIPLYFSALIVGNICVLIDIYINAVTYYAKVFVPFTNSPLSMVIIGALYFCLILFIQELIMRNLKIHSVLKIILRVILIAILNFLYTTVDVIIVRAKICVFHDEKIQAFFFNLDLKNLPTTYYISAFVYFFMAIILTGLLSIMFSRIYRSFQ